VTSRWRTRSPRRTWDALAKDRNLHVLQSGSLGYQGVTINTGNVDGVGKPPKRIDTPLGRDPRVREAFASAIDRQTLVGHGVQQLVRIRVLADRATVALCLAGERRVPAVRSGPLAAAACRVRCADAAEGGPCRSPTPRNELRYAQALQASVAEGGVSTCGSCRSSTPRCWTWRSAATFELLQLGWSGRIDPDGNTTRFLGTQASANYGGYSSPELDDLLAQASRSTDTARRAELYGRATQVLPAGQPDRLHLPAAHPDRALHPADRHRGLLRRGWSGSPGPPFVRDQEG